MLSEYEFASPACNVSANIAIHGLTRCLVDSHYAPHSLASDQGTPPQQRKCNSWLMPMEFSVPMTCVSPRSGWSTGKVEWLIEVSFTERLRRLRLRRRGFHLIGYSLRFGSEHYLMFPSPWPEHLGLGIKM